MSADVPCIRVRCPAKLNLFLEVVRRREDGYHDIETVMQAVDLFDDLAIEAREDGAVRLACSEPGLPTDGRNLVVRAAVALREATGCELGADMRLTKRIPAEAGLGGGSSDAAGALVGLNRAWGTGLGLEELSEVAAQVGSDVAFFLTGGAARCTGRGERVEAARTGGEFYYVLVCPTVRVSTAAAYGKLRFPLTPAERNASMAVAALAHGDVEGLGAALFNRLEGPAFSMHPRLEDAKRRLAETGLFAGVALTGSGSALFGVCRQERWAAAGEAAAGLGLGEAVSVRSIEAGVATPGASDGSAREGFTSPGKEAGRPRDRAP
ncbi:MAG: 4-(cytidine 5'-diphospho)-2-C-methyl-D-erythritol kinase [Planctomycetota bacterium]